jgi:hypothetical protein
MQSTMTTGFHDYIVHFYHGSAARQQLVVKNLPNDLDLERIAIGYSLLDHGMIKGAMLTRWITIPINNEERYMYNGAIDGSSVYRYKVWIRFEIFKDGRKIVTIGTFVIPFRRSKNATCSLKIIIEKQTLPLFDHEEFYQYKLIL